MKKNSIRKDSVYIAKYTSIFANATYSTPPADFFQPLLDDNGSICIKIGDPVTKEYAWVASQKDDESWQFFDKNNWICYKSNSTHLDIIFYEWILILIKKALNKKQQQSYIP